MQIKHLFIFLFFCSKSRAQSISPMTQNIGGTLGVQGGYRLTYSVGEMVSTTHFVASNNSTLSSGFLQSFTPLVTGLDNIYNNLSPKSISITPNPVVNIAFFHANLGRPGQLEFNVLDVSSNIVFQSETFQVSNILQKRIDFSQFVSGVYYVRVLFKPINGIHEIGVYKIIKL